MSKRDECKINANNGTKQRKEGNFSNTHNVLL